VAIERVACNDDGSGAVARDWQNRHTEGGRGRASLPSRFIVTASRQDRVLLQKPVLKILISKEWIETFLEICGLSSLETTLTPNKSKGIGGRTLETRP
jgi:hypothetical protein